MYIIWGKWEVERNFWNSSSSSAGHFSELFSWLLFGHSYISQLIFSQDPASEHSLGHVKSWHSGAELSEALGQKREDLKKRKKADLKWMRLDQA